MVEDRLRRQGRTKVLRYTCCFRQPEVEQVRAALREHDLAGLQIWNEPGGSCAGFEGARLDEETDLMDARLPCSVTA